MKTTWDLTALYESFESENFLNDLKKVDELTQSYNHFANQISNSTQETKTLLLQYLNFQQELNDLFGRLFSYCSLTLSTDTTNKSALKYSDVLNEKSSSLAKSDTVLNHWIGNLKDLDTLLKTDANLEAHTFFFKELQRFSHYLLSDNEESIIAKMQNTGSIAWAKLKDTITSQLIVEVELNGEVKSMPLAMARNLAHDPSAEVRKSAYECELKAYEKVEDSLAACLSNIKGEVITTATLRGYESPLDETLIKSRMTRQTLDAMLEAIEESLPKFREFLRLKASLLGHKGGLPFYDLFAPVCDQPQTFDYERGTEFVLKQFSTFSDTLANYAKKAIDEAWIDVYPKQGKVGGAFCSNLHWIKQSRFLLNYGNEFGDTITLGHELGHGFHGECLNTQTALNADYPMPIAETASTFCETIIKKAALKSADAKDKLFILENELCDCAQVIVDIYSRYLFESRLIEKRQEGPLSVEEIKDLMLEAQKEAYGHGLDHRYLHPYMWTWKPHYYEADYAFYNFPYAFGLLLAKGLYGLYQKQGATFADTYEHFLSLTGKMSLEDVGKSVGIDLQDPAFWQNSIDMIKDDIDLFEKLLKQLV